MVRVRGTIAVGLAALCLPAGASAAAPAACPGAAIAPAQVITGEFGTNLQGGFVMVPFDVPAGTTLIRVKYCYDQPDIQVPGSPVGNTLDLGLYEPLHAGNSVWATDEFRGWGGSSHPDVQVSPEGFASESFYLSNPKGNQPGKTTRGFKPGPIPAGRWAVELGVASVTPLALGDLDEKVAWRVEIALSSEASNADEPYAPAPYDSTPAKSGAGWYAGDMHVHAEHSNLGAATMRRTFDHAFKPLALGGAGLDFVTLSDYVSGTAWPEIGRLQAAYPGKLIERSAEVITYRGHTNNHGSHTVVDYRTGPIYVRHDNGGVDLIRAARPASAIFDAVRGAGGWTQINHPTIFPSAVPTFSSFCRGCPWDYTAAETDYSKVDAIEIATGPAGLRTTPKPGPNPFTPLALLFWENALDRGFHIAAVGSSDSHSADDANADVTDVTGAPVGMATTVVYADELSEQGIQRGVKGGHTYVKLWGNDGPDLRFEARNPLTGQRVGIMGDTVPRGSKLHARVIGGAPLADPTKPPGYQLVVFKDRLPLYVMPVLNGDFSFGPFLTLGAGRYRLQLQRGTSIDAVSSPIWVR
jgi:hypothetical protein